eukprot:scaffold195820_cov30-Tisochrysis_lutea.AAC.2
MGTSAGGSARPELPGLRQACRTKMASLAQIEPPYKLPRRGDDAPATRAWPCRARDGETWGSPWAEQRQLERLLGLPATGRRAVHDARRPRRKAPRCAACSRVRLARMRAREGLQRGLCQVCACRERRPAKCSRSHGPTPLASAPPGHSCAAPFGPPAVTGACDVCAVPAMP